jgi:methionyl-tRNA formyltransferase
MEFRFGMVAADTSRTRAYINALALADLVPEWVLVLGAPDGMPGQCKQNVETSGVPERWPEAKFDSAAPLIPLLENIGWKFSRSSSPNINDPEVIGLLKKSPLELFVYSGYGGALLRKEVLAIEKKFLHIHGGFLPDFKGSTTNYYSLLKNGSIGASAILLNEEIDSGPIIKRFSTTEKFDRLQLDHVYDSALRARILVSVLNSWKVENKFLTSGFSNEGGRTYFIIHPLLKHIAILSKRALSDDSN